MADGLLQPLNTDRGALGGVESAFNAYFNERDKLEERKRKQEEMKYEREHQNMLMQIAMKDKGLVRGADGGLDYDDYTKKKRTTEGLLDSSKFLKEGLQQNETGDALQFSPGELEKQALERRKLKAESARLEAQALAEGKPKSKIPGPGERGYMSESELAYKQMPKENQVELSKLAMDVASKKAITNNIRGAVQMLEDPKQSKEQKLVQARSLVKLLNSAQGADAVGAEEAKRLSSLLEFHTFNMTNPGPMFGRAPIEDFTSQLKNKAAELDSALQMSEQQIKALYGNGGAQPARGLVQEPPSGLIPQSAGGAGPKPGQVEDGYQFVGGDPASPKSWKKVQ